MATGKGSRSIYEVSILLVNEDEVRSALDEFEASELGQKYPQSVKVWCDGWDRFIAFLQFSPAARKVIYTTNSVESMNSKLRKVTRNRVQFPSDLAAVKTLWLMICNIEDRRAARRILVNQSSYTNGLTPSRKPVIADIGEPLDG